MSLVGKNPDKKTLEELCRLASQEVDSKRLTDLVEEIDRLLEEQHKTQRVRKPA
jgi:hypothetical protein